MSNYFGNSRLHAVKYIPLARISSQITIWIMFFKNLQERECSLSLNLPPPYPPPNLLLLRDSLSWRTASSHTSSPDYKLWNSPLIILLPLSPEFPLDKIKMISRCGIYLFDKHLQSTFYKMSGLGSLHSNVRKGQDLHRWTAQYQSEMCHQIKSMYYDNVVQQAQW